MSKFSIGDLVEVTATEYALRAYMCGSGITKGFTGKILEINEQGSLRLLPKGQAGWVLPTMVTSIKTVKAKPTIRYTASGKRQFDVAFKLSVVRKAAELKRNGKWGDVSKFLASLDLGMTRLVYWRKQHAQGHFSNERAVSFSRKDTMIHG